MRFSTRRFSTRCIGAIALPAMLTAAATLPLGAVSEVGAASVQPGDPAPDFTLLDAGATSHTLSDYRGKLVLLWFFGYG